MAAAGAAAAAIAQAIAASGVVVRLQPDEFLKLLRLMKEPLIVTGKGGFLQRGFQYMVSYKGLAFFTKSRDPLSLPVDAEIINAKSIWVPGA